MPALLLLQTLLQRLHQLVEAAERLDELLLLFRQVLFGEPPQPFLRQVRDFDAVRSRQRLQPLEDMAEDLVETVDEALVLHQSGAGEIIEGLDVVVGEMRVHAFQQAEIFAQRDRHAGSFQLEEERDEHGVLVDLMPGGFKRPGLSSTVLSAI